MQARLEAVACWSPDEGKRMNRAQVEKSLAVWAGQLLYPGVRTYGQAGKNPGVWSTGLAYGADVRAKLRALVRRAPEVMVRVSGGGRGMRPIRAHLLYISRCGKLEIEDERGEKSLGRDALEGLAEEWRLAGAEIPAKSHRREAFHLMLSMPPDTDAGAVLSAARDFASAEFAQHKFAMVLHEPGSDPRSTRAHVHLVVRAQGWDGERLKPSKADLARWRQVFADRLIERGIAACATRRQTRGELQPPKTLWDHRVQGLARKAWALRPSARAAATEANVLNAWRQVAGALSRSEEHEDQNLAREMLDFVRAMPMVARREARLRRSERTPVQSCVERTQSDRGGPNLPERVQRRDRSRAR